MGARFEVGQAVSVRDRGCTYAGEIVRVGRVQVDIRYLGRVVRFSRNTQCALGTGAGPAICFTIPDDRDGQDRTDAARQVLASHGVELSPRHAFTAGQVEALAEVVRAWLAFAASSRLTQSAPWTQFRAPRRQLFDGYGRRWRPDREPREAQVRT